MKKLYYLSTCSTCRRIIKEVQPDKGFTYQDIKTDKITPEQLDGIKDMMGSYSAVFNKQSRKYRELNLHKRELSEKEIRQMILDEYTLLKRPIFIINNRIFAGNNRKVISDLNRYVNFMNHQHVHQD